MFLSCNALVQFLFLKNTKLDNLHSSITYLVVFVGKAFAVLFLYHLLCFKLWRAAIFWLIWNNSDALNLLEDFWVATSWNSEFLRYYLLAHILSHLPYFHPPSFPWNSSLWWHFNRLSTLPIRDTWSFYSGGHAQIETHARAWSLQVTSDKLNPAKQQRSPETRWFHSITPTRLKRHADSMKTRSWTSLCHQIKILIRGLDARISTIFKKKIDALTEYYLHINIGILFYFKTFYLDWFKL